ncbi:MAG: hypothetical protein FD176_1092 [Rhodospirillaceae bacterium]|nr:MAG: hypothetical protein FD176_1092 [Rhodospirillaceae bacterium]TNC97189.1 MAG: Uncharacterized protein FD119_1281 [Stygiobacter sp.]
MLSYTLALAIHALATLAWVGGMIFAHLILRPAMADMTLPLRLALWRRVLPRFFAVVWVSIIALLVTGYGVLFLGYRGGFTGGAIHIDIMQITGLIMIANFIYLYFGPFQAFKRRVDTEDHAKAAGSLNRIRHIVTVNLILGLFTTAIGATGTLWAY